MSIAESAPRQEVNQRLPLHHYYRIADALLRQANIYRQEGNIIELYIILLRFSSLATDTIPLHHEYKRATERQKSEIRKKVLQAIRELECLKPTVDAEWKRARSRAHIVEEVQDSHSIKYDHEAAPSDYSSKCRSLGVFQPRDETLSRHSYFAIQPSRSRLGIDTLSTKVQYPSWIPDPTSPDQKRSSPTKETSYWEEPSSRPTYGTPSIPPYATPSQYDLVNQLAPPPIPAAVQTVPHVRSSTVADPRPGLPAPSDDDGPKHLHISTRMMDEFLAMARLNTQKNLETCGVLAGKLEKGMFSVTTLIVPKQEATSDSCQTVNEEELFEVQDQRNLFQLGWIHTHPSQTCFMSSIDLHTHYSYQVMLREAIAIVMAPTDDERPFGIFRLSEPGGIKTIQQCEQRGFHPHDEPLEGGTIYDHCSHVYMNPNLRFDIVDLR